MLLSNLSIARKLAVIVIAATIGLALTAILGLYNLYEEKLAARAVKTQHIVEAATTLVGYYITEEKEGRMSREAAQKAAMAALRVTRYGDNEYFWINSMDLKMVMHPTSSNLEGQMLADLKDNRGKFFFREMVDIVRKDGAGFVYYDWPKPGQSEAVPKVSYVKGVPAWGWLIGSGIYIDDVAREFRRQATVIALILLGIGAVVVGIAVVIARSTSGPIRAITVVMGRLAGGDTKVDITGASRRDEIGKMAASVEVFKNSMIESERLRAEQKEAEKRAEIEKKAALNAMADAFEASVKGVVQTVSSAATEMQSSAQTLSATADRTSQQATTVAAASEEASTNVQTVAAATEELSSSISEISRQVTQSAKVANQAVTEADQTNQSVQSLADAAQKIGDVVKLINDIAGQTNLLALNATIEAARAGEAGKGFAVVASEVKSLANQTARATEEISGQVSAIQSATASSVTAIQGIGKTISEINEIATTIASAVEEQGAATKEIARNVQQASHGTNEVSSNIAGVTQAASETGSASNQMLDAASELAKQSETLRGEVDKFLASIRAA